MTAAVPLRLGTLADPICGLVPIRMDEANALLVEWGHYLGRCERPFRSEGWALDLDGEPIAIAVSSSIVSPGVAGYEKTEVVELARLCSRERWATRIMLRLWREVCAPRYAVWSPAAAVAYSQNSRHDGSLYRFDGWEKLSTTAGSSGGGAWSRKRYATDAVHGPKTLWLWKYRSPGAVTPEAVSAHKEKGSSVG